MNTRKRVDGATWKAIERDYSAGEGSCRDLALRYGVKPSAVSQRAFRRGWRIAKVEVEQAVVEASTNLVEELSKELAARRVEHLRRSTAVAARLLLKVEGRVDRLKDNAPLQELRGIVGAFRDLLSAAETPLGIAPAKPAVEVNVSGAPQVMFIYHAKRPPEGPTQSDPGATR